MLATRVGLLSRVLLASNARIPGVTRSFLTSATTSSPTEASAEAKKPTAKKTTTDKSATKKTTKAKSEKKEPKPKKEKAPSALGQCFGPNDNGLVDSNATPFESRYCGGGIYPTQETSHQLDRVFYAEKSRSQLQVNAIVYF